MGFEISVEQRRRWAWVAVASFLLIALGVSNGAQIDSQGTGTRLPVLRHGTWGYIDHSGRLVIPSRFEVASRFRENLAAVRVNGRWGFIDPTGRLSIAPRFSAASEFSDGLAHVRIDGATRDDDLSGYIDITGQLVITCSPGDAETRLTSGCGREFSEGFVGEAIEIFRCVDEPGNPREYPCRAVLIDRWGYYDKTGRLAIPGPFHSGGSRFSEGLAAVQPYGTSHMGFIDHSGRFVIDPQFDRAEAFSEGLAAVRMAGRWGFVDQAGQRVIPPQFQSVRAFSGGLAVFLVGGKSGYIDRTGRVVIEPRFNEAGPFSEGLAAVCCTDGRTGYIDKSGGFVILPRFARGLENTPPFSEGVARVRTPDDVAVYIDRTGKEIARVAR